MKSKVKGRTGEAAAAEILRKKGYKILGMNFSCRAGEIDIIAQKENVVVFVEVKTRKNSSFAEAREFVTVSKQNKILKTAGLWLSQNDFGQQPRFDVIEVYDSDGIMQINHIENAFE